MMLADLPDWAVRVPQVAEIAICESNSQGIDPHLTLAIIEVESSGNTLAVRYEPTWPDSWIWYGEEFSRRLGITRQTEELFQKVSWGPMQIMGATARWLGFQLELVHLTEPEIGIMYGVKYLAKLTKKYPDPTDVISSYNAGSVKKTVGGMYQNQQYVDKVSLKYRELKKLK